MPYDNSVLGIRVPGYGPPDADLMFIGEAPGASEERSTPPQPFVGASGAELDRYLLAAGVDRAILYGTNVCKVRPPQINGKQQPPSAEDIERDTPELIAEIKRVRPRIILAIGKYAVQWFLGPRTKMKRVHGIPHLVDICFVCGNRLTVMDEHSDLLCSLCDGEEMDRFSIVPSYHPAAGLHSTDKQPEIAWDIEQFGLVVRGHLPPHPPIDQCPDPDYRVERFPSFPFIHHAPVAIDTEGNQRHPWGLAYSQLPGTGAVVRHTQRSVLARVHEMIHSGASALVMHYGTHDWRELQFLGVIPDAREYARRNLAHPKILDTMVADYVLGPMYRQALKDAGYRLLGMEMEEYIDITAEAEARISRAYFDLILSDDRRCSTCGGVGKVQRQSIGKVTIVEDCPLCDGVRKVQAVGKKGQPIKRMDDCPVCVRTGVVELKTLEKCDAPDCVDGYRWPAADHYLEFEDGELKVKRPWSIARWAKYTIDHLDAPVTRRGSSEGTSDDEDDERETLRDRWESKEEYRVIIEPVIGAMLETTLDDVEDQQRVIDYSARDADATIRKYRALLPRLEEMGLMEVFELDSSLIPMYERMQRIGMKVDVDYLAAFEEELVHEMSVIESELSSILGAHTNPGSGKQVAAVLFGTLGLPSIKLTKSRTAESTDDKVLEGLKALLEKKIAGSAGHPEDDILLAWKRQLSVLTKITDHRERSKLKGTYTSPLRRHADRDSRVHTTIKYTRTDTGRLSSADPINLQNIPKRTQLGLRIREAFVARDGYSLISTDYSQIEMVLLAHLSQDPNLCRCFREGLDMHKLAASLVFQVPYDQVTPEQRQSAKHLNFGLVYGITAIGFKAQMDLRGISASEQWCQEVINRYFRDFAPGVREWMNDRHLEAMRYGYVRDTLSGRIRHLPGARSGIKRVKEEALRAAGNFPVQCGAQTIIKRGMHGVYYSLLPMLWNAGVDVEVLMQVHDELLSECRKEEALMVARMIAAELRDAAQLSVPVNVSYKIGDRWGGLE